MLEKFLTMTGGSAPKGIVHVGAHTGQEIHEYKEYDPGVIVWIEADPEIYQRLCKYLSHDWGLTQTQQWHINALVSDSDGDMMDFHLAENDGQSSSIFKFTDLGKNQYPQAKPTGEVLRLQSHTLDTLLDGVNLVPEQVDYLVLDTQGAELKCLRGLGKYIQNLRYLTVEISTIELYSGGAQMNGLDQYLEPLGFSRISGNPKWGHGNALYLRTPPPHPNLKWTDQEAQQDLEIRALCNDFIRRYNNEAERKAMNYEEQDEMLYASFEKNRDVLFHPASRSLCLTVARLAHDNGMKRTLSASLKPLGWA